VGPGEEHLVVERVVLECSGGSNGSRYSADSSQEQGGEGRPVEQMKRHLDYGGCVRLGCDAVVYAQQLFGLYGNEKDSATQSLAIKEKPFP
jgi:hypothetical protein